MEGYALHSYNDQLHIGTIMNTSKKFDYNNQSDVLTSVKLMSLINSDSVDEERRSSRVAMTEILSNSNNLQQSLKSLLESAVESPNPIAVIKKHINLI